MGAPLSVRKTVRNLLGLAALLVLAACIARRAQARPPTARKAVHYAVSIPDPAAQYAHVAVTVADPRGRVSDLAMPAWAPGSYLIRDFARHVYDVGARNAQGEALSVVRRDKQTWRVVHGGNAFTLHYRVFAADVGVRTSHINDTHASLIGTSVLMYVAGELKRPATVDVTPPSGWTVHVALPTETRADGTVGIVAPDYDQLVDAPIELGTPHIERFDVDGTQFEYILTAHDTLAADPKRLAADARKVVTAYRDLMGGLPMKRYLFLAEATAKGGGGLEHANSTSMILRRGMFESDNGYQRAASLVAHEFFHLWNVKRIHDRVLGPFDYAHENHSRLLWFHEGFTETMESLALRRAGMVDQSAFLSGLAAKITRYRARPGRNHDPVSQLSYEAWVKGYQPADNHRNVAISYYTKGDIIGVALDLELRLRSGGQGTLPGVFRRLMTSHGAKNKGIVAADIVAAASAEATEPMRWFFDRYVDGTEEVSLEPLLTGMGIAVKKQADDAVFTGWRLRDDGSVRDVEVDSPARAAGLMRDDQIVAIDGRRADDKTRIERWLNDAGVGKTVRVSLFREDRLVHVELATTASPYLTWTLALAPKAAPVVVTMRDAWLAGR